MDRREKIISAGLSLPDDKLEILVSLLSSFLPSNDENMDLSMNNDILRSDAVTPKDKAKTETVKN
ncbi:MAG: hypothetical protein J5922_05290 [Clostridia bacterium]|nr:hypothetical protein [Clostridia bacterium]